MKFGAGIEKGIIISGILSGLALCLLRYTRRLVLFRH